MLILSDCMGSYGNRKGMYKEDYSSTCGKAGV